MTAAQDWADALAAWAIPDEILAAAPESPWGFPVALFHPAEDEPDDTPSRRAALDGLAAPGDGGSVLDVGCGAGAASLALVPPATRVVGVDASADMLAAFARGAERRGVEHAEVEGRWPDVAHSVEVADVVLCHHVFYNVADLPAFASALTDHARRRVVTELSAAHPQIALNDLWRRFWNLDRPQRPTADDALAVLRELGLQPHVERWKRPPRRAGRLTRSEEVAFTRRRLCLPAERDAEIDALLPPSGGLPLDDLVTVWWGVT